MDKKVTNNSNRNQEESAVSSELKPLLGGQAALDRIWFEIRNMTGYELEWEWMAPDREGEYVKREEVLAIIDKITST